MFYLCVQTEFVGLTWELCYIYYVLFMCSDRVCKSDLGIVLRIVCFIYVFRRSL